MARDTVMKKPKDTRGAMRRMLGYLGPWRYVIFAVALVSLFSNVLNLWGPSLAGSAIREAAAGPGKVNFGAVRHYAGLMLLCYAGSAVLGFGISMIMTVISKRMARQMRQAILRYMESKDFKPALTLTPEVIGHFFTKQAPAVNMFTNDSPDELKPKLN